MMRSALALTALFAAVLTLALTSPANVAQAGKPQDGCVALAVTVEPDVATVGDLVTGTATVVNCGPRNDKVTVELTLDGPAVSMIFGEISFRLKPGEERSTSVTIEVPPEVVAGAYTATAEATSRQGGKGEASAGEEVSVGAGTSPVDEVRGCADGSVQCQEGQICCVGVPYPHEGECQQSCGLRSDRNLKVRVEPIDPDAVLEHLAGLSIAAWSYRNEAQQVRHMGPMAQDFHAAFGLGGDEHAIHPIDANGVVMASIQALNRRLSALERENASLQGENESLRRRLAELEQRSRLRHEVQAQSAGD
jgi:hypothetical protein